MTDYTAHACWAERGVDAFCVASEEAKAELERHPLDGEIVLTGIPVRAAFRRILNVEDLKPGERLRVLVSSGGFAVGPVRNIVSSLAKWPNIEIVVVCGHAENLRRALASDARKLPVRCEVVGFEPDMARRVEWAHIVIGKAGGLTLSETMTAGRPMVLVGSVPGNETSNVRFAVAGGGALVADGESVGAVVRQMVTTRRLASMGAAARGLVLENPTRAILDVAMRGLKTGGHGRSAA